MSRAFVREDGDQEPEPRHRFDLPPRDSPEFEAAAAWALIEGADRGDSLSAEAATGFRWGEPRLREFVRNILDHARTRGDDRLEQLAERYLRAADSPAP